MTATTASVVRSSGCTYRQLDYWARCGYLRPYGGGGSGYHRRWADDEVRVVTLMVRLIDAGMTVPAAAELAREAIAQWWAGDTDAMTMLAPGIILVISDDTDERRQWHPAPRVEDTLPL